MESETDKNLFRVALGMRETSRMTDVELRERLLQKIRQSLTEKTRAPLSKRKTFGDSFQRPITTRVSKCYASIFIHTNDKYLLLDSI